MKILKYVEVMSCILFFYLIFMVLSCGKKTVITTNISSVSVVSNIFEATIHKQNTNIVNPLIIEYYTFNEENPNETKTNLISVEKLDYLFLADTNYQRSFKINTNVFEVFVSSAGEGYTFYYVFTNKNWYLYRILNSSD